MATQGRIGINTSLAERTRLDGFAYGWRACVAGLGRSDLASLVIGPALSAAEDGWEACAEARRKLDEEG